MGKSEITIVFTTWPNHPKRWEYFYKCAPRVLELVHTSNPNHAIKYVCISESVKDPLQPWFGTHLKAFCMAYDIPLLFREDAPNLGAMMNSAMEASHTKYTMIVQDDWYLECICDLSPGISLMDERPDIDIIRYSWPGNNITIIGEVDGWRKLSPTGMWPYGDDPHIRRDSFTTRFGKYITYGHHGASEGDMVYRFGHKNANVLLADKCYFGHCGEVSAVINDERERAVKR